jgi:F-type H+-transporting ATPase subunit epsilon
MELVTREKVRFKGDVEYLKLPGWEGEMGILHNHAPLIAILRPGEAMARAEGQDYYMAIGDGFVKVHDNKVLVLVSFALRPEEIEVKENEAIVKEEEQYIHDRQGAVDESDPHRMRLAVAKACISVAKKHGD